MTIMNVTELALALYAADLPESEPPTREVCTFVRQGVARLGGTAVVSERAKAIRELNLRLLGQEIDQRQHEQLVRRLCPDRRRFDRCLDYAHPMAFVSGTWDTERTIPS